MFSIKSYFHSKQKLTFAGEFDQFFVRFSVLISASDLSSAISSNISGFASITSVREIVKKRIIASPAVLWSKSRAALKLESCIDSSLAAYPWAAKSSQEPMGAALLFARYSNRLIFAQDAKLLQNFDFDQQFAKFPKNNRQKADLSKQQKRKSSFFIIYWRKKREKMATRFRYTEIWRDMIQLLHEQVNLTG